MGYAPAGQNLSVDSCYPDQKSSMKKNYLHYRSN